MKLDLVDDRGDAQLSAEALRRLAALPGMVGIKHAVGGIDADTIAFLADLPPDFVVLGGEDAYISPLLALGAHGGILAAAHVAPAEYATLPEAEAQSVPRPSAVPRLRR
ncbi:dihydrodipicolinate synthase family protein [Micromonospora cremea]|uniref:dihydrodipicolinate synthase family protein n=1 Tax=Micromonospora cremea TaxID=709881 RepID=UPI000A4DFE16